VSTLSLQSLALHLDHDDELEISFDQVYHEGEHMVAYDVDPEHLNIDDKGDWL